MEDSSVWPRSLCRSVVLVGKQMLGDRSVMFLLTPSRRFWEALVDPHHHDGCLTVGLRLLSIRQPSTRLTVDYYSVDRQRIAIEVLTDKDIERHVTRKASINILDAPRNQVALSPPHWPLNKIKEMVQRNLTQSPGR